QEVRISGWIHRTREHANVLFVDLRDHYGITQVVIETSSDLFAIVDNAGPESVITVTGKVSARAPETLNPKLDTGEIEVFPTAVVVQSQA
ncbi:OB-fold nucleic acid binding domain-containing protein, partial [Escherichia coli]